MKPLNYSGNKAYTAYSAYSIIIYTSVWIYLLHIYNPLIDIYRKGQILRCIRKRVSISWLSGKSWVYAMDFEFDDKGLPVMKSINEIDLEFSVLDHNNVRQLLSLIAANMGKETLGIITLKR